MSPPWCWGRVAPCAPSSILGSEQSAMSCTRERAGEVKKGGINERRGRQRRRAGRWERCRGCSGIISSHPSVDRGFGIPRALLGTPQPALSCNCSCSTCCLSATTCSHFPFACTTCLLANMCSSRPLMAAWAQPYCTALSNPTSPHQKPGSKRRSLHKSSG